jgi:hypothetical protein
LHHCIVIIGVIKLKIMSMGCPVDISYIFKATVLFQKLLSKEKTWLHDGIVSCLCSQSEQIGPRMQVS